MQSFMIQFWDLFLIQLTNWRWSWRGMITISLIVPVLGMLGLSVFVGTDDVIGLRYIIIGNIVFSLLFSTNDKVASNFAYMREMGTLDFFASLPIHRSVIVLATASAFLLLSIPTVLALIFIGAVFLDMELSIDLWIIIILPLIGFCLSGLGACIGTLKRPVQDILSISSLVSFLMLFTGPVLIPPERLPALIQKIGLLSPATYAASALRHVLLDQPEQIPLIVDMIVLSLIMLGFLWLSTSRMDWRQG